jgi:hypothetical protein
MSTSPWLRHLGCVHWSGCMVLRSFAPMSMKRPFRVNFRPYGPSWGNVRSKAFLPAFTSTAATMSSCFAFHVRSMPVERARAAVSAYTLQDSRSSDTPLRRRGVRREDAGSQPKGAAPRRPPAASPSASSVPAVSGSSHSLTFAAFFWLAANTVSERLSFPLSFLSSIALTSTAAPRLRRLATAATSGSCFLRLHQKSNGFGRR